MAEKTQEVEAEKNKSKVRETELLAGESHLFIFYVIKCRYDARSDLEREEEERKDGELSVAAFKRKLACLSEKCARPSSVDRVYLQPKFTTLPPYLYQPCRSFSNSLL